MEIVEVECCIAGINPYGDNLRSYILSRQSPGGYIAVVIQLGNNHSIALLPSARQRS
jgi:hypothetical protein